MTKFSQTDRGNKVYRKVWIVSTVIAVASAFPVAHLKNEKPWLIGIPICFGVLLSWGIEWRHQHHLKASRKVLAEQSTAKIHVSLPDSSLQLDTIKEQANQGLPAAQFLLGRNYENGTGFSKDLTKALYWYQKAAEANFLEAKHNLGMLLLEMGHDELDALKWLFEGANAGSKLSQFTLGLFYEKGTFVKGDMKESFQWYLKAAQAGYAEAQYNVGSMLAHGDGVKLDKSEAIKWYGKAASQGHQAAGYNLKLLLKSSGRISEAHPNISSGIKGLRE